LLRSDRLLGLPPADRQSCGCSPAIEGISTQYPPNTRGFPLPRERQAPITQLATKHRDPRQARTQPGGEPRQKGCDDIVTLGRAVCTHRMGLGGSRQRLGNDGCRQRAYDAGNRLKGGRKRRSTCISAVLYVRSAAESAGRHAGALPPSKYRRWIVGFPGVGTTVVPVLLSGPRALDRHWADQQGSCRGFASDHRTAPRRLPV
jgi:hypothetical protein